MSFLRDELLRLGFEDAEECEREMVDVYRRIAKHKNISLESVLRTSFNMRDKVFIDKIVDSIINYKDDVVVK